MCGIVGIFHNDKSRSVSGRILSDMLSVISHRGPDDESCTLHGRVGLGHCRLSIIDLPGGRQPIYNEDRSISIVFNGEIYNYKQFRHQLIKHGHKFRTKSDTEVIIHAYEQYGNRCVEYLNGMFAFGIWDSRKETMFLARDRLGIKPLFYFSEGGKFLFSSEIKALLKHPSVSREIDHEALEDYLTYGYIPAPKTIFKGIRKLLPGYTMTIKNEGVTQYQYWDAVFEPNPDHDENYYIHGVLEHLKDSIESHMISDVPVGAFLSGGIDSSTIVGIMSQFSGNPVDTFSIGFDEPEYDELQYARTVSNKFNTQLHEKVITGKDGLILEQIVQHYDEPFADAASIPNFYVSRLASEKLPVCLSGDGGDEIFAGYSRFIDFVNTSRVSQEQAVKDYFNNRSYMTTPAKSALYSDSFRSILGDYNSFDIFEKYFKNSDGWDTLSQIQYVELKTYLADDILVKVDRSSMINSLEVRVPFLDHELLEFINSIPAHIKLRNNQIKYLLRSALADILPVEITVRPKMGLMVPLQKWFRNDLRDIFVSKIFKKNSFIGEYFNTNIIHEMWIQHQKGIKNHFKKLWALIVLETWAEEYITSG